MPSNHQRQSIRLTRYWPALLGAVAILCWVAYLYVALSVTTPWWIPDWIHKMFEISDSKDSATIFQIRGQIGDTFGAYNALISTMAFIGLLWTIVGQQKQIADQEAQARRNDLLVSQQQFQEQFFRAIDAYRDLLASIKVASIGKLGEVLVGREALNHLWRSRLLDQLYLARPDATGVRDRTAVKVDIPATAAGVRGVAQFCNILDQDAELRASVLQRIGHYWADLYLEQRYQLDALFRAWYTVYRVLETAPDYHLSPRTISLYSASFRAQLSWIELAFLLINQSGLEPNEKFPRACHLSNKYVVFDNLSISGDILAAILRAEARRNPPYVIAEDAVLLDEAFACS